VADGRRQRLLRQLAGRGPHAVEDEAALDPEVGGAATEPVDHRLDRTVPVAEAAGVAADREGHLAPAHALRRLVLAQLVGDPGEVLGALQAGHHLQVLLDEVREVDEAPGPVGAEGAGDGTAGARRQVHQGVRSDGTLEVDVQIGLRESGQVAHGATLR
jgi:hypothetical protein